MVVKTLFSGSMFAVFHILFYQLLFEPVTESLWVFELWLFEVRENGTQLRQLLLDT